MMDDYYKVLGLKRGASLKEISAAYRSLALIYHPDKRKSASSAEDDEKFQSVKAAYQALQDPKMRAELDLQLIGQEERLKRDAQMSAQRKQMRDELLSREKEAMNPKKRPAQTEEQPSKRSQGIKKKLPLSKEEACLTLKCKIPANLERNLAKEMIKSLLGENVLALHEVDTHFVAEFKDSKEAYKALCKLPADLIIKADWYTGNPPDDLEIKIVPNEKLTTAETSAKETSKPVKYSKEFENSILEKLKQRKNN